MGGPDPELASRLTDLGRWTRSLVHMLNNSLTGILGYAKLGQDTADEATRLRALEQIERAGAVLRKRARILLEYGRVLSLGDEPTTCRAPAAFEGALQLVTLSSPGAGDIARPEGLDVPALAAPTSAVAQILANLIENALDAVDGDPARVTLGVDRVGDEAVLTVIDDGDGLSEAMVSRAFEPFLTTKATVDDAIGGDGLGLSLARRMAEAHGGRVELSGAPGQGARASLVCPLAHD